MEKDNKPIGIFDSGIGGLTVVKSILSKLPNESLIYIGDTARVPYGTRGKEVITQFALELTKFLLKKDVKALVVACNTISSVCLEEIKKISPIPILDVINPTVEYAVSETKNNKIGVIGTRATISSGAYAEKIRKLNPKIKVYQQACPLFVSLVEEGMINNEATLLIAKEYLKSFEKSGIDSLILGCTHYPLLTTTIKKVIGQKVKIIDSSLPTAKKLAEYLEENEPSSNEKKNKHEFYLTDVSERSTKIGEWFLGNSFDLHFQKAFL